MLFRRNSVWWYDFSFRNQRVRESTHSRCSAPIPDRPVERGLRLMIVSSYHWTADEREFRS
jgi:hypothetical protein